MAPHPASSAATLQGLSLLPGATVAIRIEVTAPLNITRADTVVLGLGLATLVPDNGVAAITTADVNGLLKDFDGARSMMRSMMGGKRVPGMMKVSTGPKKR